MIASGKALFMLYMEKAVSVFHGQACVPHFNLTGIFGIFGNGQRSVTSFRHEIIFLTI
jgi:hypothetical protein